MIPSPLRQRAEILIQQHRYTEAERFLKDSLSSDPTDVYSLSLLAEVNIQLNLYEKADLLINSAIGLAPERGGLYFTKARIAICRNKYDEAEENIRHSIAMNPAAPNYYALWASVKLTRKQYQNALELSNQALALEPENLLALNTRSTALLKLNQPEDSFQTIEGALREDPNNAFTHANYGWNLLENNNQEKALEHFREALKNEPNSGYAQSGMLEALKANNFIYKSFLRYSFWIGKLTARYQWGVILGIYAISRLLRVIANNNEGIRPFLMPVMLLLAFIALSTWIISPVSNLFLRLSKYGKHLLDQKEKISANFVGACLVIFVSGLTCYLASGSATLLAVTVFGFAMMVPCGSMFETTRYKYALIIYTTGMALTGTAAIFETFRSGELFNIWTTIFIYGFLIFQWAANFLIIKESNV
jgi:tetratricopeptide (TPR) repeat protein